MSDADPTQTTPTEAPDQGASVVQEPTQPPPDEDLGWLSQRFPHATTPEDQLREVAKAYRNIEPQWKQTQEQLRQFQAQAPEPEYEEPPDPYAALPMDTDPQLYQRFHNGLQRDPQGTIDRVLANPDAYGTQIVNEAFFARLQMDPMAAIRQVVAPTIDERFTAFQQQHGQELQPWVNTSARALGDASEVIANQMAPDFGQYRDQVIQYLEQHPVELDGLDSPQAIAEKLVEARDRFWARDQRLAAQQQQNTQPQQSRGQAQTRSTTPRPSSTDRQTALLETMRTGNGLT